ncbi:N/A [soil metagenome]
MREPPEHLDPAELLDVVRTQWDEAVDRLEHLPVGFGAHHWAASVEQSRRYFVTFDRLAPKRSCEGLERAYCAAASLSSSGLEFVLASLSSVSGGFTVPLGTGAVSVTPWTAGRSGSGSFANEAEALETASHLGRLHASKFPPGIPVWEPVVRADLGEGLSRRIAEPSPSGPFGERARAAVAAHLSAVYEWVRRYVVLTERAERTYQTWVPTHGEPDTGNQLVTPTRRLLVDWESLALAPRERDLDGLLASSADWQRAYGNHEPDAQMLEMFDLEWRLSEIAEYAAWFRAPHTGTASDTIAFGGLIQELGRPDRR